MRKLNSVVHRRHNRLCDQTSYPQSFDICFAASVPRIQDETVQKVSIVTGYCHRSVWHSQFLHHLYSRALNCCAVYNR